MPRRSSLPLLTRPTNLPSRCGTSITFADPPCSVPAARRRQRCCDPISSMTIYSVRLRLNTRVVLLHSALPFCDTRTRFGVAYGLNRIVYAVTAYVCRFVTRRATVRYLPTDWPTTAFYPTTTRLRCAHTTLRGNGNGTPRAGRCLPFWRRFHGIHHHYLSNSTTTISLSPAMFVGWHSPRATPVVPTWVSTAFLPSPAYHTPRPPPSLRYVILHHGSPAVLGLRAQRRAIGRRDTAARIPVLL